MWPTSVARPTTIIANRNLDQAIVVVHLHTRGGGMRMPDDIRQCLSGDAVHRRSSLAGNRFKIIRQLELDSETSRTNRLDQIGRSVRLGAGR
jgi:hypothetical protein